MNKLTDYIETTYAPGRSVTLSAASKCEPHTFPKSEFGFLVGQPGKSNDVSARIVSRYLTSRVQRVFRY
ncbi:hypothetical protein MUN86_06280 [Hymenobacter volaticus]|uniref:Uncharacterized protein n=1 Tax=Hymenobacter volaticus TaxID=2932254 RepID=A0ABY4G9A1_9BACT|nr:hypothetical protein MUN86_06280 [Hymenobacter volaticus]